MRINAGLFLVVSCLLLVVCSIPATAKTISSNELIEKAQLYDGKTIEFQGEVIGDIMARGNYAWLNVNDGTQAIGVWAEKGQVQKIKRSGDYKYIGDEIKIIGVFHRACPDHGGDLDIHAREIHIAEAGHKTDHPINSTKALIAAILFIAILALILIPRLFKSAPEV